MTLHCCAPIWSLSDSIQDSGQRCWGSTGGELWITCGHDRAAGNDPSNGRTKKSDYPPRTAPGNTRTDHPSETTRRSDGCNRSGDRSFGPHLTCRRRRPRRCQLQRRAPLLTSSNWSLLGLSPCVTAEELVGAGETITKVGSGTSWGTTPMRGRTSPRHVSEVPPETPPSAGITAPTCAIRTSRWHQKRQGGILPLRTGPGPAPCPSSP